MRKHIKKLLCSSLIAIMSIGCFNAESRVTREVAEATLPYLMEAVGIPSAQRTSAHVNAIINMIYTDAGQREMVNWARSGDFPHILSSVGFNSVNTHRIEQHNFQLLFPCGPGTFSSYATHISRLGYHALMDGNPPNICKRLFEDQAPPIANVADVLDAFCSLYKGNMPTAPKLSTLIQHLRMQDTYGDNRSKLQAILNSLQIQITGTNQQILSSLTHHPNLQLRNSICDVITNVQLSTADDIDTKLSIILFVLDICDNSNQVFDILDTLHTRISGYQLKTQDTPGTRETVHHILPQHNEYNHRPISATSVTGKGDCVQTLYRHLVNIAIQNDVQNPRNLNVDHLPEQLHEYYTSQYKRISDHVVSIPITHTESGKTELDKHSLWDRCLKNSVLPETNIANATVDDIVNVLNIVSLSQGTVTNFGRSALGIRDTVLPQDFSPTIQSSPNQGANAMKMQDALNGIDGRCSNTDLSRRFIVNIQSNPRNAGINTIIEVTDRLWKRRITLGVWANRHAEIIAIQQNT